MEQRKLKILLSRLPFKVVRTFRYDWLRKHFK